MKNKIIPTHQLFTYCMALAPRLFIALAFCCAAVSPAARAGSTTVVGEDRGKNNSAAEGIETLNIDTTGQNNTAHGWFSLSSNTTGNGNTANGYEALFHNTAGASNTADGAFALFSNTTGVQNTSNGASSLQSNTTGMSNTATGVVALKDNTTGSYNTATGFQALLSNTIGDSNTATGVSALGLNTTGGSNTACGLEALGHNTIGSGNTANGYQVLEYNTTALGNTATGYRAMYSNTTGSYNTAYGASALGGGEGQFNTAIGHRALIINTTGSNNVALGYSAGANQWNGSGNIYIGADMRGVVGENNACYIGSIFGQTSAGGTAIFINSAGKLGTTTSSRRFKQDIKPMNDTSAVLFALNPVTFHYKSEIDPDGIPQFGLIAEDVEKVAPDLVVRDKEGKANTVRYEQINAMLLNEFLKEHKNVQAQQSKITQQDATIAELKTASAQQTAKIEALVSGLQKVSTQLRARKPSASVVLNDP